MKETQGMYFIFDANSNMFGNPKGYKRMQDAQRICTRYRNDLWSIYEKRRRTESSTVFSIKIHSECFN